MSASPETVTLPGRGSWLRHWRWIVRAFLIVGLFGGGYYLFWRTHTKRFLAIEPGVLYRVGQPTEFGLEYLVRKHRIRTVLSLQRERVRVRRGVWDEDVSKWKDEAGFTESLGAQHLQWPLGDETFWPWPTPWVYESFFQLVDDPAQHPILIHCAGGRHRTGTLSALYRLEYDRWPVELALDEMYGFDFGHPIPIQEHNLRTYRPRPLPTNEELATLHAAFGSVVHSEPQGTWSDLILRLRPALTRPEVQDAVRDYIANRQPFSLPLAARLVQHVDDPLNEVTTQVARNVIGQQQANPDDWVMAASLIADFGPPEAQQELLALLTDEPKSGPPSPRYQALVAGVTNRYTLNRVPYLRPLLDDQRHHLEPQAAQYRFCDTAVVRLSVILDNNLIDARKKRSAPTVEDQGVELARQWFKKHQSEVRLSLLEPPRGKHAVREYSEENGKEVIPLRR